MLAAAKTLTYSHLLARAGELSAFLRDQSAAAERQGRLTDNSIDALAEANLFSLLVPRCLGGAELWPTEALEIIETLSRADGSAGWVVMATQVSIASCGAYLVPAAAQEIFRDHIPLIAGQGAPVGRADAVDGGYRLNGDWSYGSGLLHSEWVHTGAAVHENGAIRNYPESASADTRIFIVPIASVELKSNWDVMGLRASGSVDYSIRDLTVPEEYTHRISANRPHSGGDLYRLGIVGLAALGHTGFTLGIARRLLDEIAQLSQASAGRPAALSQPGGGEGFHSQYARAEAQLRAARAFAFEIWKDIQDTLSGGNDPATRQITLARLAFINANSVATSLGTMAFEFGGGTAIRSSALQRAFRDQRVGAQHFTASDTIVRECAKDLLGLADGKVWTGPRLVEPTLR
jgi:alkylation response protein AidB-like acyl-CoA dehydrogenase